MRAELHLMGVPTVRLDGRPVAFRLRKGLALLAFLAMEKRPIHREQIAGLLWPDMPEDAAKARLRRTLHKLRVAAGQALVDADKTTLDIASGVELHVDALAFEAACNEARLDAAFALYGADFLSGFSLEDCPEFNEWAFYRREALRSRLMQVLDRLIESKFQDRAYREASVIANRLVSLDPLNEAGHRHLIKAYLLAGDRPAAERQYRACESLLADELGVAPDAETAALLQDDPPETAMDHARTRYARRDEIHIAYQTIGVRTPDIILVPGFVSHIERAWDEVHCRGFLNRIAEMGRLIIFDRRGIGLSDRVGSAPTVEATADDIHAVMDATGSRRAFLIGCSEGGPGCIHFAAHAPDRLHGLVLYGSLAKGSRSSDYAFALTHAQYEGWLRRLIENWGDAPDIETFAPALAQNRQARNWWTGLLRAASSPGAVKAVLEALRDTDVRRLLPEIGVPTLVLHRRQDRAVRFEAGRHLAEMIPGARFDTLDGEDHWPWAGDAERLLAVISTFIADTVQSHGYRRRD